MKTLILHKSANFGQNSRSKTILESGKIFASNGHQIFISQKIDFSRLVPWSKSTPPKVFFSVHRMMGHTQTNILRVFLKKKEIIKFFRKWKKQKSDLNINSGPHGSKKFQLWGGQIISGPQNLFEVPHFRILKNVFFSKSNPQFSVPKVTLELGLSAS